MKTLGMMKIAEQTKKNYKASDLYYSHKNGFTRVDKNKPWPACAFDHLNDLLDVDYWEEVKEPVTWQEAFQAGLEGKKIKVDGQGLTYLNFENLHFALFYLSERPQYFEKLMNSNWYIE